jgi:hypothetical protein
MKMNKRKILGLEIYLIILLSILMMNDIVYLKIIGVLAIILLIGDTLFNKL